jgi:dTDP-4-dehydrorhamnose reductase
MMNTSILLIGSNGQVGRAWQKLAKLQGIDVICHERKDCDLSDSHALRDYMEQIKPQVIINAAAYTAVDQAESDEITAYAINATAVDVIANYLSQVPHSVLVHYSTDYVFSGDGTSPYSETDLTDPQSVYGKSKLAGELAIQNRYQAAHAHTKARHYILRTSWVFGDGQNFVRTMLRLMSEREHLKVVADQIGAPSCAEWLAQIGIILLRADAPSGLYHASPHGSTSWHGLAMFIKEHLEKAQYPLKVQTIAPIPSAEYPQAAKRPLYSSLNHDKIEKIWRDNMSEPYPEWPTLVEAYLDQLISTTRTTA